jgi:hypothetical protein
MDTNSFPVMKYLEFVWKTTHQLLETDKDILPEALWDVPLPWHVQDENVGHVQSEDKGRVHSEDVEERDKKDTMYM